MRSRRWLGATILSVLALAMVAPFLYMVSVSLMDETELLRWPPPLLPDALHTGNYAAALEALPFAPVFVNSAILAGCVMVGQVLTSAAAGYAFARMRFPGRDRVFVAFLAVLTVPAIVLLIPRFMLIEALGWVDTYTGLISTELVSVWGIFLMRQFFLTLPRDVEDAARLDGAGEWTLFWRVMLPLAKPGVAALAVLAFMDQWRSFLWPLIVTRSAQMQVVEVGLANFHTLYGTNWPYQMAAAVTITLPLIVVCLLAQRYLMQGLEVTGPR
ncbi:MAG TPA: carbohydrate ABC transporter permease [Gemmatimonadales bacterium]|nr:carbohydrate ABC transporter permease [Gemmatimonadales bacterium]